MRLAIALALSMALAACGGGHSPPSYVEAREPKLACPAPTLVSGGVNPAVEPLTCSGTPATLQLPATPRTSALPAVTVGTAHGLVDLGEHAVGEVVPFDVPAGTASFAIMEQLLSGGPPGQQVTVTFLGPSGGSQVQDNAAIIGELHDPSNRLVYTDLTVVSGADLSSNLLVALGAGSVVGTVAYPSSSAGLQAIGLGGVQAGTWKVMVNDYGYECALALSASPPPGLAGAITCPQGWTDTRYRVYVLTTPAAAGAASAIRDRGSLDVAVHIVDAPTPLLRVTSASAPADPSVQRMVQTYGNLLAGAGLCLGTVTFLDAPDWARTRFATATSASDPTPCGNLPQLLALSRTGLSRPTIELFMLPAIQQDPTSTTGTVVGVDGTIPGPASVNGTPASGAILSGADLKVGSCPAAGGDQTPHPTSCGADSVGYVAAHETGHFLGLYHPTESSGDSFDPLNDTPHCECTRCGQTAATCTSTGLPGSSCLQASPTCGGGGNLMFWLLSRVSAGYLSPEQARLARSSPAVTTP